MEGEKLFRLSNAMEINKRPHESKNQFMFFEKGIDFVLIALEIMSNYFK